MLRRKAILISLLLVVCFSATAFAESVAPSAKLTEMVLQANDEIEQAIIDAQTKAARFVKLYENECMRYDIADKLILGIIDDLYKAEQAALKPVLRQAKKERYELELYYFEIEVGWYTILIDPIIVHGNA